jgi:hypothetical protein
MNRVDMTVSSTPAWTRQGPDRAVPWAGGPQWRRGWSVCCLVFLLWAVLSGQAWAREPEIRQQELLRSADGLQLSVRITLEPSAALEDALLKGVPVYFVWQADVVRERWYWTNKRVSSAVRTLRLAYQPLTRRWRVSLSTDGAATPSGLQYALHQNFDALADALASVSRVASWQVAEPGKLDEGGSHELRWRFGLDLSLLPRPFQIGVSGQPGWDVGVERRLEVPVGNEVEPGGAAEPR